MVAGKKSDGLVSRAINRRFSRPISRFIVSHNINVTPNQITFILLLSSVPVPLLYYMGHPVIAGILVQLISILDGVDGEIARYRKMESKMGALLDSVLDRVSNTLFIAGATYYAVAYENMFSTNIILLIAIAALSGDMMVSYLHSKVPELMGVHPALIGKTPSFASRDVRLFILFLTSIAGAPSIGLLAIALLSHAYVAIKLVETAKYLEARH